MVDLEKLRKSIESALQDTEISADAIFGAGGLIDIAFREAKASNTNLLKEIAEIRSHYLKIYNSKVPKNEFDSTIPCGRKFGQIHPLSKAIMDCKRILSSYGLTEVEYNLIEDEFHNFDALNVDEYHPARRSHDTFYMPEGLLRTHITGSDIRAMESGKFVPPFGIFSIGATYRRDDDATHSPMFHQLELFLVDKKMEIEHLKYALKSFLEEFFGQKVQLRFRPSYFPFTEPSIEVDMIRYGLDQEWLEVAGSGMIRKNILERYGYGEYRAIAFGLGVERICMLKYGIDNINDLYKNRYPFLQRFGIDLRDLRGER